MERPMSATLRPCLWARSMAMRMRWMEEEKQEKKMRRLAAPKMSSRRGMTAFSPGVKPGRSTLVESWRRQRTFCLPRSAKAWRSKGWPSGEERSILKSPVWTTMPTGGGMAKEEQATRESGARGGVDADADGGVDGEGDAVDQRMRHADREDREDAEVEPAAGEDLDELGVVEEPML